VTLKLEREPSYVAKHQGFLYQNAAVDAIHELEYSAIFHEQGLGKTKIGVDLSLLWLKSKVVDSVLIVTKKGLLQNWRDEIALHSHLQPRILGQDRRKNFYAFNSPARLYLTHYEVLRSERKRLSLFLKTRRVAVLLDEAHRIKNPDSQIAKTLFDLSPGFTRRVIMTGTPVANRPYDLWAQIYFLDHGKSLGNDFNAFKAELDLTNELARSSTRKVQFEAALASLFQRIQQFSVRETKQTAHIHLPNKEFRDVWVDLAPRQEELYERFRRDCAAVVVRDGKPVIDDAEEVLKRLLRLVQVASNPRLVDDAYHETPSKLPVLEDLVAKISEQQEKAIVWTSFTENVDWLFRELQTFGAVRVHGKMAYEDRDKSLSRFKTDADCKILVATPGAAKEGLTLTVANHAVFYDRSFSLDDYLQAQDRIHRISQTKTCYVVNLVARGTVDEWVDELLSAKQLAAKLGQGDITKDQYQAEATYAFAEMIREVLRIPNLRIQESREADVQKT
jgi:SNF2 family DNA or RNA helicase